MAAAAPGPRVERRQVLAHRVSALDLHRTATRVDELAVLDLGVQDAMGHAASVVFAARLPPSACTPPVGPGHRLALAWTLRGAPHVHRRADLDRLARGLWPLSEADAGVRLTESGPAVVRAGITALEQFRLAVDAMRAAVPAPTAKGAASTRATELLPAAMRRDCRPCGARHLSDPAMRAAALMAGLEIEPGTTPPVLVPRAHARRPTAPDPDAASTLAATYLALLGPATDADVAGFLGARRQDVRSVLPGGLAPLTVDGRAVWLPADLVDALLDAPPPDPVRLLGPFDPYLQARDRDLLVPDRTRHRVLWPVLGRPGAVLAGGEIVGVWRTKATARRLTVTITAFDPLPRAVRAVLDGEAAVLAGLRGLSDVAVVHAD